MLDLFKESLVLCWNQGNESRGAGRGIPSCVHGWAGAQGVLRAGKSSLLSARQCHGVSVLLLSQNVGSDPKLGTFERKRNPGGCSGLGVRSFKQSTDFPEQLEGLTSNHSSETAPKCPKQ